MGLPRSTFYDAAAAPADETAIVARMQTIATSSRPTATGVSAPRFAIKA
jgi:hypothetical protein